MTNQENQRVESGELQTGELIVGEPMVTTNSIWARRLSALLSVKSVVTLILTGVFAYQAVTGKISQDFMTIYAVIIAFYFGTQSQKIQDTLAKG